MGLDVAVLAEALSDVQFSIVAGPDRAIHFTGGAGIPLRTTTRSAAGDGPKTPECLGCRPAGTSLLSLGRAATC